MAVSKEYHAVMARSEEIMKKALGLITASLKAALSHLTTKS